MLSGQTILIIGHDDWDMWRQANVFATGFSRSNHVVFLERVKNCDDLRKERLSWNQYRRSTLIQQSRKVSDTLEVLASPPMLPYLPVANSRGRVGMWALLASEWLGKKVVAWQLQKILARLQLAPTVLIITRPLDLLLTGQFGEQASCWYVYDETSLFYPEPRRSVIDFVERRFIRSVDIVFASSWSQYEKRTPVHDHVHYLPNAVDYDLFHSWRCNKQRKEPSDVERIRHPRIVYIGQFGGRDDLDLLYDVFRDHPAWSLVMIGWIKSYGRTGVERLRTLPNVYYLGPKLHHEIPGYLATMDVGLIPFLINESTQTMHPLKLFEYFAAGLPVVSTPLQEVKPFRELVYMPDSASTFTECIKSALDEDNEEKRSQRLELAERNSWTNRLADAGDLIAHCIAWHSSRVCKAESPSESKIS